MQHVTLLSRGSLYLMMPVVDGVEQDLLNRSAAYAQDQALEKDLGILQIVLNDLWSAMEFDLCWADMLRQPQAYS